MYKRFILTEEDKNEIVSLYSQKNIVLEQEISVTINFDSILKTFPKKMRLEVMLYVYKGKCLKLFFENNFVFIIHNLSQLNVH